MADDHIPTRDTSNNANWNITNAAAQQKQHVAKISRDELEDKYLRMYEENIILKKYARKQEDKIKWMGTKLQKLVDDKKKLEEGKGVKTHAPEEKYDDTKVRELEKQNMHLREKLSLLKQQLSAVGPSKSRTYRGVQARINTNLPPGKHGQTVQVDPRINKSLRVQGPAHSMHDHHAHTMASHSHHPQTITKTVTHMVSNPRTEEELAFLREKLDMYELETDKLREQLKLKDVQYEEDILKIKKQVTSEQKVNLQGNIDMIKLQRDVKEKSALLTALQDRYQHLEESSRAVKASHDQILREMEHLNLQFQEEQNRNLSLQNELKLSNTSQKKVFELQEQVNDLQKECDVLKEANEGLLTSAFDLEREREWRQREKALKVQIAQLEATTKSDLGEKVSIIDTYAQERDAHEKLQAEHRELQINYYSLKEQMDDLNEKMKFFTKESAVDFTEIEEALVLIKQKKQREQSPPDFLQAVDDELNKDHRKALVELQAEYAETVHELEKTRNMLVVQHKINKDYQTEVQLSAGKMDELKKECEMKLDEYARLLDIRAARIKKLEAQLRDVAYGTRQYRLPQPDDDLESTADFDETISLERGQNLFEIHIENVSLSKDALQIIGDDEPSLFCTWDFFDFEVQSTPVVRGSRPVFDFTSQYIVKVDDFFLHYLQKNSCTLELHQSYGQEYGKIAVCQLIFKDIFDKPHGRIHGKASLTGIADGETGIGYGTVEYWIRLRVPMEQALRLYKRKNTAFAWIPGHTDIRGNNLAKAAINMAGDRAAPVHYTDLYCSVKESIERTKALGYIMTNERMASQALEALDETAALRPPDNVNELHVKVIRCSKLQPRRQNVQPSPYCAYKLLDFPDHATIILRNTNSPEFNDRRTYSVPVNSELDQYLRTAKLQMFIFDDTDPEVDAYLGVAEIPLIPLAHNKPVSGEFQLTRGTGKVATGVIEVELRWQYHYLPPKVPKHERQELEMAPDDPPQRLEKEGRPTREELEASPPGHSKVSRAPKRHTGPSATSTPMVKDTVHKTYAEAVSSQPKPAHRKVHIAEDELNAPSEPSEAVDKTVSAVVSKFMPNMSESISSVPEDSIQELTSIRSEPAAKGEPTIGEESEGAEELQARPTPPRSSLELVSGSEEDSVPVPKRRLQKGLDKSPKPKARTQLLYQQPQESSPPEDEEAEEEEMVPEEIEEDGGSSARVSEVSEPPVVESDSDGVMTVLQKKKKARLNDAVTIVISKLSLEEDSPPMLDDNVKQLYVEYSFFDQEFVETPDSLPKPKPHRSIEFNFSKTFPVDMDRNYERRRYLAGMLVPKHQDHGRLKFTVISEPPSGNSMDESVNCEEVGVAYISFQDMLKKGEDLVNANVEVFDIKNEKTVIGYMELTVMCVDVLKAIDEEIQIDETY